MKLAPSAHRSYRQECYTAKRTLNLLLETNFIKAVEGSKLMILVLGRRRVRYNKTSTSDIPMHILIHLN